MPMLQNQIVSFEHVGTTSNQLEHIAVYGTVENKWRTALNPSSFVAQIAYYEKLPSLQLELFVYR